MQPLSLLVLLFLFAVFLATHAALVWIVYGYDAEIRRLKARLDSHGGWLADLDLKDAEHDRKLDSAARLIRDRPTSTFILPPRSHPSSGGSA